MDKIGNDSGVWDLDMIVFGLQGIIRHLLYHPINESPTIILIESYPHGTFDNKLYKFNRPTPDELDYTVAYRKIAQQYQLPIISYRDAVNNTQVSQSKYADYVQWQYNLIDISIFPHIHWHAHLFQADIIGSSLLTFMNVCKESLNDNKLKTELFIESNDTILPLPMSKATLQHAACPLKYLDRSFESNNINIEAREEYNKSVSGLPLYFRNHTGSVTNPGTVNGTSAESYVSGWRLIVERNNKIGYVSMFHNESNHHSNNMHTKIHRMHISLNASYMNQTRHGMLFKLEFLGSYENMGKVRVSVCGKEYGIIDGLHSAKYSVSQIAVFTLCSVKCISYDDFHIDIEHKIHHEPDAKIHKLRNVQKFKILSLHSC